VKEEVVEERSRRVKGQRVKESKELAVRLFDFRLFNSKIEVVEEA